MAAGRDDGGFFDEARIYVRAGSGGAGAAHFRREKFVPRGGPDGGDGGRGGDVVLRARANLHALTAFQHRRRFVAPDGAPGEGQRRQGRAGRPVVVDVPCGTVVYDADNGAVIADLVDEGQTQTAARGGAGGAGNERFKSPRFQTPALAMRGARGEERRLHLELELLADAGLVGAPNAGKSSLLARISAARPKAAPYPFTTLQPVLGVVAAGGASIVVADLPGLIEGAAQGAGLGARFLRHVRRARALIHVVDGSGIEGDPIDAFRAIDAELGAYDPHLLARPRVAAFNKMDLGEARRRWPDFQAHVQAAGMEAVAVSAATGRGLSELIGRTATLLAEAPPAPRPEPDSAPVLRPRPVDEDARLFRRADGAFVVRDARLERLAQSLDFRTADAADYFQRRLDRRGVTQRLERAGAKAGDTVVVGELEFEWAADGPVLG